MKKYPFLSVILGFASIFPVMAQQEFQFGNYTHNPYLFNPAAGGLTEFTQLDLGYRNQNISSEGNPVTMYLSGTTQIYSKKDKTTENRFNPDKIQMYTPPLNSVGKIKHIVGGRIINDAIGPFQKTGAMATYGIHLPLTHTINIGAGIGLGWNNISLNPNKITLLDANDQIVQDFGSRWGQNNLDLQAGIVVYMDRWTFSASATQLLANKLHFNGQLFSSKLNTHWMVYSSYKAKVGSSFMIEPFAMLRVVKNAPASVDVGANFHYRYLWLGAQYRTNQSFVASFGLNFLRNLYLSYAFEYSGKKTRVSTAGTHEVQLGIYIGRKGKKKTQGETPEEKKQTEEKQAIEQE